MGHSDIRFCRFIDGIGDNDNDVMPTEESLDLITNVTMEAVGGQPTTGYHATVDRFS